MSQVYAFEARCGGYTRIVNSHTRGRAVAEYLAAIAQAERA